MSKIDNRHAYKRLSNIKLYKKECIKHYHSLKNNIKWYLKTILHPHWESNPRSPDRDLTALPLHHWIISVRFTC